LCFMKGSWQRANQPLEPIAAPWATPAQLFVVGQDKYSNS
jgi:hypothetical protein